MVFFRSICVLFTLLLSVSYTFGQQCASFNAVVDERPIECNGDDDGRITVTVRNQVPGYTYNFSINGPLNQTNTTGFFTGLVEGTYNVSVSNANIGSCNLGDFLIEEPPPLNVEIVVDPPLCGNNGEVCAVATGGNIKEDPVTGEYNPDEYFYIWSINPGPPSVSTNRCNRNVGGGNFKVTVSDNRGCIGTTEPDVDVIAQDTFKVSSGPDLTVNYGDSVLLESYVDFDAPFSNPLTIQWNPLNNLSSPNDTFTYVKPCESTDYIVSIKSNDADLECFDTTGIFVTVSGEFAPWAPNAFTPNNIGPEENETFKIYGRGIVALELSVYDRRGALVFSTFDKDEGWDGLINGNKEAPNGTYLYVARATSICGEIKGVKGDFTLLR